METYRVRVRGTQPWLQNRLTLDAVRAMYENQGKRKAKDETYKLEKENQWQGTCMFDSDKGFYVPVDYIEGNLKRAGASFRMKRDVLRGLRVVQSYIPLVLPPGPKPKSYADIEKAGWVVEHVVKQKNVPNIRRRVCIPVGWEFEYEVAVDETVLDAKELKKIITKGGEFGYADWNPKFGTFELVEMKKVS